MIDRAANDGSISRRRFVRTRDTRDPSTGISGCSDGNGDSGTGDGGDTTIDSDDSGSSGNVEKIGGQFAASSRAANDHDAISIEHDTVQPSSRESLETDVDVLQRAVFGETLWDGYCAGNEGEEQ